MATTTRVTRWGNSLGVRLPQWLAREARVGEGDAVEVSIERQAILIRPARPRYSLAGLTKRITPANRHGETDWGGPVGGEPW